MADLFELPTALALRKRKRRYNVSLDPEVVRRMDEMALKLGTSRSELITFAFHRLAADMALRGDV